MSPKKRGPHGDALHRGDALTERTARALEQEGKLEEAARLYGDIGATGDAARVLVALRRYGQAGDVLMRGLGVYPSQVGSLNPEKRKVAFNAAICFGRAGRLAHAAELFAALGEHPRAIEMLERAGDFDAARRLRDLALGVGNTRAERGFSATGGGSTTSVRLERARALENAGDLNGALDVYVELKQVGHAARVAQLLGMNERAATYYLDAGMPYEAAVCYRQLGDTGRCLDALIRVPRDDARYPQAALQAIDLASELSVLEFAFEQFLTRFLEKAPSSSEEAEGFYKLARLYERHSHKENARALYARLVLPRETGSTRGRAEGYRDAAERLGALEKELRGSPRVYERILREEMAFRGERRLGYGAGPPAVDELPPLPDLPDLPPESEQPPPPVQRTQTVPPAARQMPRGREAMARTAFEQPGQSGVVTEFMPSPPAAPATPPAAAKTKTTDPAPPVNKEKKKSNLGAFAQGAMVDERYRLERRIGRGGMASVYKARDEELGIDIALKVFSQPIEDDEQLLHRFKQELILSRQLTHPNIIRLYDIGIWEGHRYITMELLTGGELKSMISHSPLEVPAALDYLMQACDGLQYAHDQGVVHRDVKPQNFFITEINVLKVMDFGIAKRQATSGMTVTGMIAGTPNYMSPEQINGFSTVTASTDIYALGCIAYEMLTGTVPFSHQDLMPLLMMHLTKTPEPPRARNPRIPPALEQVILRLMEKDPARRYPSCKALAADLERLRGMV